MTPPPPTPTPETLPEKIRAWIDSLKKDAYADALHGFATFSRSTVNAEKGLVSAIIAYGQEARRAALADGVDRAANLLIGMWDDGEQTPAGFVPSKTAEVVLLRSDAQRLRSLSLPQSPGSREPGDPGPCSDHAPYIGCVKCAPTTGSDPLDPRRVSLWDGINRYARACGGDDRINGARMAAVVEVERVLTPLLAAREHVKILRGSREPGAGPIWTTTSCPHCGGEVDGIRVLTEAEIGRAAPQTPAPTGCWNHPDWCAEHNRPRSECAPAPSSATGPEGESDGR
jgi:hypothetical protein